MRVMVINPRDGSGFDWQAPARSVSRTIALSSPCMIQAAFPAEYNKHVDEHGHPWILERGTILVVEEDNKDLISGIVTKAPLLETLDVTAGGLSTLSKNVPWDADPVSWTNKDALEAWREIWVHVIARSGVKNLRIIGDTRCGVTVGKGPSAEYARVQADIARLQPEIDEIDRGIRVRTRYQEASAQKLYRAAGNRKTVGKISTGTDAPSGDPGSYYAAHITHTSEEPETALAAWFYRTSDFAWVRYDNATVRQHASDWLMHTGHLSRLNERRKDPAQTISNLESWMSQHHEGGEPEPFELNAWSTRDLGAVLEELRDLGGFDYVERTRWDGDDLIFEIEVRNQLGVQRSDLRFELDINVQARPELARGEVRTEIHAHGAGEGQSTLMADRVVEHPRLVRTVDSLDDKDWATVQQVRKGADKGLAEARKALGYTLNGVTVRNHSNAPFGTWGVGDTITIRGRHSDGVLREFPIRVTQLTRDGDEQKIALEGDPV